MMKIRKRIGALRLDSKDCMSVPLIIIVVSSANIIDSCVVLSGTFRCLLFLVVIAFIAGSLSGLWWVADVATGALLLPLSPDPDLHHFRRSRSLKYYFENIQLLIQPSSTACDGVEQVPVIILVTSSPGDFDRRSAIRQTWATSQPTYFILGLEGSGIDENFVDIYVEAKEYGDLVVFDLEEHYQNLTLKTALMLQWTLARCPQAEFVFKTDDDVFVNPWMLEQVLMENRDAKLLGFKKNNTSFHRDVHSKWYVPRWIYRDDELPEYLSGTGYILNGQYIKKILKTAERVPIINLEDVYFTFIVAKKTLGLKLSHDRRLSPYKPWIPTGCSYWGLASAHSLEPEEILNAWFRTQDTQKKCEKKKYVCSSYQFLSNDLFLY